MNEEREIKTNNSEVKASENGIRIQGFIEIELVNKKEHYRKTYKNTITRGGKQFLLAKSAGEMLTMSASMRGNPMINDSLVNRQPYNSRLPIYYSQDNCLTNALLYLDTLQTGLTESSTFVNLFDSTGVIDTTKVIGYANNNISPTANGREGSIDYCKDEYVADGFTVCERWKYPEGVASGTIDTIAMIPSSWKSGNSLGGQRFSKCLDKVNTQQATFLSKTKRFCPPGITGFTSNDEILLNYEQDSVNQHKYTISTGEITDNPTTFFVFPEYTSDIVKIGDYVYAVVESSYVYIYKASDMSQVTYFSFPTSSRYNARLIVDSSNNLWISLNLKGKYSPSGYPVLYKCSNNGTYFNGYDTSYTDYSQLFTLPSGFDVSKVNFGMCGSTYVMYALQNEYLYTAILFTNTSDILGSIVDIIPSLRDKSCLFTTGTSYGVIDIGQVDLTYSNYLDTDLYNRIIKNNSNNSDGKMIYTIDGGLYLTMQGWYSTIFSFVKLNSPITKQDTDIMYVSYGYKVV